MERRDLRPLYRSRMVVAVGGPPHSGKSVFLAELYRQLLAKAPTRNFVFLQRMCPDGEGVWSGESSPEVVKEIRRKGKFAAGFLERHLPLLVGPALVGSFRILLADLGGVRSAENAEILRHSTHCVVLSSKESEDQPWVEFTGGEGCKPLAILRSRLFERAPGVLDTTKSTPDQDWSGDVPLCRELWQLDRHGPPELYRGAVSQFADWLIAKQG